MALQHKTITNQLETIDIDHDLNTEYLQSDFTLENCEISVYYPDKWEARDATVKLMLSSMALSSMRLNPLSRKFGLHDFHRTGHYESSNQEIKFMNVRLYQINYRKSKDFELYSKVSVNKIYRSLKDFDYLKIEHDYYSVLTIRRTLGACYRSRIRETSVFVSDYHDYLCFKLEHGILMIRKEKHSRLHSNWTEYLIEPKE